MNSTSFLRAALAALLVATAPAVHAVFDPVNDDTDIFLANPNITATRPNVLIWVDNSANWSRDGSVAYPKVFDAVKAGLAAFFGSLTDSFNVGLAMMGETGEPAESGSYIRYGVRQMTTTNRDALVATINGLTRLGDNTNNAEWSLAMMEMYRYYAAQSAYAGFNKTRRDYYDATAAVTATRGLLPSTDHPFSSSAATTYKSPIADGCQKNFIIFISNGAANENTSAVNTSSAYLSGIGGSTTTISLSPSGQEGNVSDEWARYMANNDCAPRPEPDGKDGNQYVYTYAIDVLPDSTGQGPASTALLRSMATVGKGKYFAVTDVSNTDQFTAALRTIFTEVQSVNSVFASTTLPVSVNVRGTNLNQVYIGVFRPDSNKSPRWLGNLKLFKLGVNTATVPATLFLADATGGQAENSSTGFITATAQSYWTASSSYWSYRDSSLNGSGGNSDLPDGDLVEKGGAAQRLRVAYASSQSTRPLYTCTAASGAICAAGASLSSTLFDTSNANVTAADFGALVSYTPTSLTSSGTTATIQLGAAPNPVWAAGNEIRVSGASPEEYNGTYTLATVDNTTFTYTYTLGTAPDASAALATGTSHGLQNGDTVTVSGTTGLDATDAAVTRLTANTFRYVRAGASGSHGSITVDAKKPVTTIICVSGATSATALIPNHAYAATNSIWITGATESFFNHPYPGTAGTVSAVSGDSVTYSMYSGNSCSGGGSTVQVTANGHNLATNQSGLYIVGNSQSPFNTGALSAVTVIDANRFTFASTHTTAGTGGTVGVRITNFDHPNSGGGNGTACGARDVLTVTTGSNHNIVGPYPFAVTIAGAAVEGSNDFTPYNGTWTIASAADVLSATSFRITQTSTTNSSPAGSCSFSEGGTGSVSGNTIAGRGITSITPVVSATGSPIKAVKQVSLTGVTSLTNATGTIAVGRTADGDATERANIIGWVRGADNKDNEKSSTAPTGIRPSIHGDVLHSRPAVVNYNRYSDDNDIYAYYGGNDGIIRAVKGGLTAHTSGADTALTPGLERWGFIPREFFPNLKRLRDQNPSISATNPKNYFADGSIGVYQEDSNNNGILGDVAGDKVYLYVAMRRGGRFIYALDVTNPADPKLLWRRNNSSTGWGMLGYTWSEPKVARVNTTLGTHNPRNVVLIFGAGYDPTVDDVNPCLVQTFTNHPSGDLTLKAVGTGTVTYTAAGSCTITNATGSTTSRTRSMGRGIMIVDAFNGEVVWQVSSNPDTPKSPSGAVDGSGTAIVYRALTHSYMFHSIPSDVTVLDKNRDGIADRIYVGDTGARLWRLDISDTDTRNWRATRVARLDSFDSTSSTPTNQRKFLFPPDVVAGTDASGSYMAVLLGTGDREHPFDTTVTNRFYMIKDRDDASNELIGKANNRTFQTPGVSVSGAGDSVQDSDLFDTTSQFVDDTDSKSLIGWKLTFSGGEKTVSSATTIGGTVFWNTNQPSSTAGGGACGSNLGIAREYKVGYYDASATTDVNADNVKDVSDRSTVHAGGGYLPSPVPVVVEIDGKKYQAVISGTSVSTPPGVTLEARTRVYWYKEVE